MLLLLRILLVFALLITGLHAQTKTVLKNINDNTITESLTIGSGKTLTIASGASIVAASGSTITGFGGGSGSGSVTSVALSLPSIFTVTGSPITESGTLTGTLATQTANRVFAGPTTGNAAAPTFRALVAADIPDLTGTYQPLSGILITLSSATAAGLALMDDANAAAQRTTLGLGTIATQSAASVSITGGTLQGVTLDGATISGGSMSGTTLGALGAVSATSLTLSEALTGTYAEFSSTVEASAFIGSGALLSSLSASSISSGTLNIARIADGAVTSAKITDGTIVNADINASAAIAGTKVDAGTTTTRGTVELATDGETAANVVVQGNDARLANANRVEIGLAASDEASDNTASTTIAKVTFRMPYAMTLTGVRCSLTKAATGALFIVDIHESGTSIMTTNKLSVDASETTSLTAATAAVITDSSLANDAVIEIFIDQVGTTTDNTGEGVKVWLIGNR